MGVDLGAPSPRAGFTVESLAYHYPHVPRLLVLLACRRCRASRFLCTRSLAHSCNTAASSQTCWERWHVASASSKSNDGCRGSLPAGCRCVVPLDLVCKDGRWAKKASGGLPSA